MTTGSLQAQSRFASLLDVAAIPVGHHPEDLFDIGTEPLGRGSFAIVYYTHARDGVPAHDLGLARRSVFKVLRGCYAEEQRKFAREAQSLQVVQGHPNVVRLHGLYNMGKFFAGGQDDMPQLA